MHNIKDIRNNFDHFKNIIKSRNISINLDEILDYVKNPNKNQTNTIPGKYSIHSNILLSLHLLLLLLIHQHLQSNPTLIKTHGLCLCTM